MKLRRGGRILGGSLSWDKPQKLAGFSRESPFNGMPVPNDVTVTRQVLAEPDALLHRTHLGDTRRRHAAGHRAAPRQRTAGAVPRHRRYALVRPAAVRRLRRHAPPHRRARRRQRRAARPRATSTADAAAGRAADPRARRLRRLHGAAADRPRGAGQFQRPRQRRSSARLLRAARRPGRGQYAGAERPAGGARFLRPQCPPRRLPPRRAARPARADLPRRARPAAARRAAGDHAVRRHRQHAAAPARGGNAARSPGCLPRSACSIPRMRSSRPRQPPPLSAAGTSLRHEGDRKDAPRLHHHRRFRRRRSEQGRPAGPHAVSRAAHRARSRRADGARSGARRARLLPADLLADLAERAEALAGGAREASTPT